MKRRQFVTGLGLGSLGSVLLAGNKSLPWRSASRKRDPIETINTAKNLIFILLDGAPSHVDTFDLKTEAYTPDFLGATNIGNGTKWPAGTMPKLAQMADRFSLVRSISAVEAVHERAVYHLLTAHRQSAALAGEIPSFASVMSYKFAGQRQPDHSLPTVMTIGDSLVGNGFFPLEHMGLSLDYDGSIKNLSHDFERADDRFGLLEKLWETMAERGDTRDNQVLFQKQARGMMLDEELNNLIGTVDDEQEDSTVANFKRQCETAVRILSAKKGTRVFQMVLGNWDHHDNIYEEAQEGGLADLSRAFDEGFSYLIETLAGLPGGDGNTMLDETLIVAMGEFGRTVGRPNTSQGRDHYPQVVPAIFAGGGVKSGRVIGATDRSGGTISDPGWPQNRYMTINDLITTIYSALGVDWTERFEDTPSGRVFEIVDSSLTGPLFSLNGLFT